MLFSGDIHFTEVRQRGPGLDGRAQSPFWTLEFTSSPMHSILFPPPENQPEFWPNSTRVVAGRAYNYVDVTTTLVGDGPDFKIEAVGVGAFSKDFGRTYEMQNMFTVNQTISTSNTTANDLSCINHLKPDQVTIRK